MYDSLPRAGCLGQITSSFSKKPMLACQFNIVFIHLLQVTDALSFLSPLQSIILYVSTRLGSRQTEQAETRHI